MYGKNRIGEGGIEPLGNSSEKFLVLFKARRTGELFFKCSFIFIKLFLTLFFPGMYSYLDLLL